VHLEQWLSKWAGSALEDDFEEQEGEKSKGGDSGAKQHKGCENSQPLPLID